MQYYGMVMHVWYAAIAPSQRLDSIRVTRIAASRHEGYHKSADYRTMQSTMANGNEPRLAAKCHYLGINLAKF